MTHSHTTQLAPIEIAFEAFQQQFPTFAATRSLDTLRATEYARLDAQQQVYLDYTGGGLYAECQLREHLELLCNHVFGNPHSTNPASQAMTTLVDRARQYVLTYFHASSDEYVVIFTANASAALKLVGESYPFTTSGRYLLTFDNHNSVNGIREFAHAKGTPIIYEPLVPPDLRVNETHLYQMLTQARPGQPNLFAYPAQSNVTGVQHPLDWIAQAQSLGWDVLVDCAAFVPTNHLDLSVWHPDFVPLSFYKMFGYPTGIGCLLARKSALAKLRRPWFAGGTITLSSVLAADETGAGFYLTPGEAGFEDGTINYLMLPAIEIGLRYLEAIGMEMIHERVRCLTGWLLAQLLALHHSNGQPVVRIYGPTTTERRGGTIAFNFCDPSGTVLDCYQVQEDANQCGLSLRSGCFCNPGVREIALGLPREDLASAFRQKEHITYEQFLHVIDGRTQGALRVSVGLATNFSDVYHFLRFAQSIIDRFTSSPPTEQTRLSPESSSLVCLCGYNDTRRDKQFCPRCGRPAL
ncbi:aminotransferase class V-fold PLP-dependent enzyme [Reticulibacter mediterranei]|uniref:Aminotransferase class V-fold PLP-dependent enzyme n=1 Tax=Reticulibacter mediterranei TaxID=2778369 RepID=A0A8J3IUV7_9CHLR|nr:aminotransferase class V-fold PLP-dependent enzyme [Reticulibacter mediterranei]GHP01089.1 aminotransferase class V-fold PLP-dependent enzyme [Reticulibacter mediterranei]